MQKLISLVQRAKFSFFGPPAHFGWLFFAFLAFCRATDYVYKIWLSLVERTRIFIFEPPPQFWVVSFCISNLRGGGANMYTKFD